MSFRLLMWISDEMVILCQNPRGSAGIQNDCMFFYLNRGNELLHCYLVFIPKHLLLREAPYSYLEKYQEGLGSQESNFSVLRALGMRVPQTACRPVLLQKSQKLKNCVLDRI